MSKNLSTDVPAVVADIYEAAYDQNRWMDAMKSVCDLFDGSRACIVRAEPNNCDSAAIGSYKDVAFEAAGWDDLGAGVLAKGMMTRPVGDCYRRSDVVDQVAFQRTHLWQSYFGPREMDDSLSCNLRLSGGSFWSVDVARSKNQGEFNQSDIRLLKKLTPHLLRAGEIGNALQGTSILSSLYAELPFGMLIVDAQRRVYHLNRAAEIILSSGGLPLVEKQGKLVMSATKDAEQLQRMIASACAESDIGIVGPGGTAIFPQTENAPNQRRLLVSVAPLSRTLSYGMPTRRNAAVMIREIGREGEPGLQKNLPRLFGLSPAEARIAMGLADGKALKDIATENEITIKTARSYLETVFRKTGTHRQSELVSIIKSTQPILS